MSICYDLRFPELYRRLRDDGAEVLAVPSAFTLTTGRDHWYPLLRARAIETQCYVVAPAQWGRHDDAGLRESYGHALIADPWGQVVAAASDGPGAGAGGDRPRAGGAGAAGDAGGGAPAAVNSAPTLSATWP